MKKLGLVFAGGGGKGAYEIGVWKALREYGVDKNIRAVSGTSVGGLNGALFAKGDLKQGLKVWESMSPDKILQINPDKIIAALGMLNSSTRLATTISKHLGFLKSEGVFGQEGLESIIRNSLQSGELESKIPLYICATDISDKLSFKALYKKLNNLSYEDIVQYLLATSAIPIAFPTIEIDGVKLLDGFLSDNTPIKPLVELEECTDIIVVLLGRSESISKTKQNYPDVNFWEIVPTGDIKESLGSLDFKKESAIKLIEMGYKDTLEIVQNLYEFMQTEEEYLQKGKQYQLQDREYKDELQKQQEIENSPKESLELLSLRLEKELQITHKEMIDSNIDKTLDAMGENSQEISKFAFDAVTSLASNKGKINYQLQQGSFSRVLGGISGANHKLQADINQNFAQSIYANTQLIKKLAQRENLTLDIVLSLGNKINYITQQQTKLKLQDKKHLEMMEGLRDAIITLGRVTRDAVASNSARIERLEHGQNLLNWSHNLKASIEGLGDYESIMRTLGSYYNITKGSNSSASSDFFYAALLNCGFDKMRLNVKEFVEYACKKDSLELFKITPAAELLPLPQSCESYTPIFASLSYHYENKELSTQDILMRLEDKHGVDLDVEMDGVSFAFELLNALHVAGETKNALNNEKSSMQTELAQYGDILSTLTIDSFTQEIESLQEKIDRFKIVVPIIGKFSSGKSRLLNSYLSPKKRLFEVDTNPTTARACEIHYAKNNSVIVHTKDDTSREIAMDDVNHQKMEDVVYLEYFLNFEKLKLREDLVLVDMPGFESSNLNHNDAINHYFSKGEHYILVLSCESVNDNSILKHIEEILSYGAKFSVVITKVDKKLPQDVESLKQVLTQNIKRVYKQDDFFVGKVSATRGEIDDFAGIVDTIYADSADIFKRKFTPQMQEIHKDIENYIKKLLDVPSDTIELEKKIESEKREFESELVTMQRKLKNIEFEIVSEGSIQLKEKAHSLLLSNVSKLVNAAKRDTLTQTITETLRGTLNATFSSIIKRAIRKIEEEALNISTDLEISISHVELNTTLSWWKSIVNFFFDTQADEIEQNIQSKVIPNVINEVSSTLEGDLQRAYIEIKKIIDEKIEQKKMQSIALATEMKKQIALQKDMFEKREIELQEALKKLSTTQGVT